MSAALLSLPRSGRPALAAPIRRRPAGTGWRTPALFGVLLLAAGVPASAFDGAQPSSDIAQDLALDSSGVPASANWVVLDATGIAAWRAQDETQWHGFTRGEVLPPGSVIETGADGEIVLVAGGDQLTIAPKGRLIVPLARPGQDRRLRHERGRILVQIESRAARDVRVDTPLLSLGIKGTTFEVEVAPEQDSVVVHDGEVEVTTPGQTDPVDLGAGDGLRQPAIPGASPTRFTAPGPDLPAGAAGEPAWRLPAVAPEPETVEGGTPSQPAGAHARSEPGRGGRAAAPSRRAGTGFGWLDDLAASWAHVAIAGVALLMLTIPGLALVQNLREQWRSRPRTTGRRRRELVRG